MVNALIVDYHGLSNLGLRILEMDRAKLMNVRIATGELQSQIKQVKMLALDWSHIKGLITYDGKKGNNK